MKHLAPGFLLLTTLFAGCAPAPAPPAEEQQPGAEPEAVKQCARGETTRGLDVSYYQGRIDWPTVRAHDVAFAFARVADGAHFVDPAFAENWAGMKASGVIRGSYQFFRPAEDPIAQADVLLREIRAAGGLSPGDLPPALDVEVTDDVPREVIRARALAWLGRVEAEIGRPPIVYTSPGFWESLDAGASFDRYTLWVAHWGARCPTLPGSWERWRFWQGSSAGAVAGIEGPVDVDWFDGTRADLEAFAGSPGNRAPQATPGKAKPRPKAASNAPRKPKRPAALAARAIDLGALLGMIPRL